jgi:hypothetical protein
MFPARFTRPLAGVFVKDLIVSLRTGQRTRAVESDVRKRVLGGHVQWFWYSITVLFRDASSTHVCVQSIWTGFDTLSFVTTANAQRFAHQADTRVEVVTGETIFRTALAPDVAFSSTTFRRTYRVCKN